jgi:hypothetical protein
MGGGVQRWGEPRETVDVDLTLLTGFGNESVFVTALLAAFEPRVPDPVAFARDTRVVLLRRTPAPLQPGYAEGFPSR